MQPSTVAPTGLAKYVPILGWLPEYPRAWLRYDLVAGLTAAAVVIPQAMAYASLAGLPVLSLPAGFGTAGLPGGVQLIGPRGADAAILALGRAWHAATDWPGRCPPAAG